LAEGTLGVEPEGEIVTTMNDKADGRRGIGGKVCWVRKGENLTGRGKSIRWGGGGLNQGTVEKWHKELLQRKTHDLGWCGGVRK